MSSSNGRELQGTRARLGRGAALGGALLAGALIFSTGPALAAAPPVFDNIPTTLPGNVPSISFEATSTSEFGDLIQLAGTERSSANLPVTVVMSSWACETGGWTGVDCTTTPGATFPVPITLTIYNVTATTPPGVGSVVLQTTHTFDIPYRPSWVPDGPCTANGNYHPWYSAATDTCYNGLAHAITFDLPSGTTLPDQLIWTVTYDTADYGYHPTKVNGPINSLNVGTKTFPGQPAYGIDVEPSSAFVNSAWSGGYTADQAGDGGPTGVLRDTSGGWTGYAPLACFGAACSVNAAPPRVPVTSPSAEGTEQVGGATGTPRMVTPPPTSSGGSSGGSSSGQTALFLCVAFGAIGMTAVVGQRRSLRR